MTTKRDIEAEIEQVKDHASDTDDMPPVFVEYGPNGEVITPGLFGVRSREDENQ